MLGWPLPERSGGLPVNSVLIECGYSDDSAQSYSVDSICWPRPLRVRSTTAIRMPMAAFRPVATSTIGTPSRVGSPPPFPLILLTPPTPPTAHPAGRPPRPGGRAGGFAVDAHQPRQRLHRRVVAGQPAQRAAVAEAGDAAMNEPRKALRQHLVKAHAPALQCAGLEILDQHVGVFKKPQHHLAALGHA